MAGIGEEQDAGGGKGRVSKAENRKRNGSVENLAGEFHTDGPAIFAGRWLAMRGVHHLGASG